MLMQIISGILFFLAFALWYRENKEDYKNPFLIGLVVSLGLPFIILAFSFMTDQNSIRFILQKVLFALISVALGIFSFIYYRENFSNKEKKESKETIKIPEEPVIKSKSLDLNKREKELEKKEKKIEDRESKLKKELERIKEKDNEFKKRDKEIKELKEKLDDDHYDLKYDKEDIGHLKDKAKKELEDLKKRKEKLLKLEKELREEYKKEK